ncbi:MAG: 50S ribosomal protein L25, partial [Acidobacteria bacterium]|nr:50S ribosomal protein L25 [Acidobacteriota bacterium]
EGVLEQLVREIEIRCDPRNIPDAINLDVTELKAHEVLHVSDISVDENIEILDDPETAVATVGIVREEPVEEVAAEEGAEPEVIGKGDKEGEEDGEEK